MNTLDTIYSSLWIMTALMVVILFLFIGLSFFNPFKNNKFLNFGFKGFMYAIPVFGLVALQFTYYGFAHAFKKIYIGDKTICLFEQYERGGDGPSETVGRIHVIDKANGLRKDRFYSGAYGNICGLRNDTLCYMNEHTLIVFDAANLKEIYRVNEDEWESIYSDFSVGMDRISDNQNSDNSIIPYIELECKNGKHYWFDPFSKHVYTSEPKNKVIPDFSAKSYELCVEYGHGQSNCFLHDQGMNDSKLKRIVPARDNSKLFNVKDSSGYIDPQFLCIDTVKKVFVFAHYFTTEKNDFYIEAKNFDFKTIWKKTSAEFGANDSYSKPELSIWKYKDNILYFNSGGFVLAVDPSNANLIWKSRL